MSSIAASPDSASQARALPPSRVIGFAVALSLATIVLCLEFACGRPHPGIELHSVGPDQPPMLYEAGVQPEPFEPGTVIAAISTAGGQPFALRGDDLAEEPDSMFAGYAAFNTFFQRQEQITAIQRAPEMELHAADGRIATLRPARHRPLSDLPFIFWLQLVCAVGCWLTGAAIFAFRPEQAAARYCAVTGFGSLLMAGSAAVYSSRELALPGELFRTLSSANHFGALLTIGAFTSVMWHYPHPLGRVRPAPWLIAGYLLVWLADFLHGLPFGNLVQLAVIILGFLFCWSRAVFQWRAARGAPL
ncbi:MAG: hypothetical protein ACHQIO_11615, partial [Nevskiales bacterium]